MKGSLKAQSLLALSAVLLLSACATIRPAEDSVTRIIDLTMSEDQMQEGFKMGMGIAGAEMPDAMMEVMTEFMEKHLDLAAMQQEIKAFYVENFTAKELSQLADFYASDVGRKQVGLQPRLGVLSAKHVQAIMAEHRAEFMEMIQGAMRAPR